MRSYSVEPTARFWRTSDLAGVLGLSVDTLRDWARDGRLPAPHRTPTGRLLWPDAAVQQFLRSLGGATNASSQVDERVLPSP
jgi:predicted site-specific integrase-resolvase